jgi:hypothetical protein
LGAAGNNADENGFGVLDLIEIIFIKIIQVSN